jgi:hypothetical protein
MIKSDKQLVYSKEWVEKFAHANHKVAANEEKRHLDPDGWQLIQDSNDALRSKLLTEIKEYEALIAHNPDKPIVLSIENLDYLPDLLIKARIAFKITHKELAAFVKLTEKEIESFESQDYQNASFLDFTTLMDALGIKLINGKFVAHLDNFYKEKLINLRVESHLDDNIKAAS